MNYVNIQIQNLPTQPGDLRYRPDIDGLRAVAVVAVVLNHAGIQQFPGGFFGVDIFFVISGYLISGLILTQLDQKRFSIRNFYQRRCRRILPALVAMMLGILPFAYFYLLPPEFEDFSKTLLTAAVGLSNFYFYKHAGYFDAASAASPLLHTWSLGVEEQFYLFSPALSAVVYRLVPNRILSVYVLVLTVSLAYCAHTVLNNNPASAFYLLPSRAWELALGAIISFERFPLITDAKKRTAVALVGAALIAISISEMSAQTPYLGIAAIIPCLGCALIIEANRSGGSLVATALSSKVPVFIGLISYSLYLWHWPILVFARMRFQSPLGFGETAFIIGASVLLASVSWKFVETPFRRASLTQPTVFKLSFGAVTSIVLLALLIFLSHGLPSRFPENVAKLASYMHYDPRVQIREGRCFVSNSAVYDRSYCLSRDASRRNVLIFGDSHAAHLWLGFSTVFPEINFLQATVASCPPTISHEAVVNVRCSEMTDFMYREFLPNNSIDTIILEAAWSSSDVSRLSQAIDIAKQNARFVVLFGPVVHYDQSLPKLLAKAILSGDPTLPFSHRNETYMEVDRQLAEMAAEKKIQYVSFFQMLCGSKSCETTTSDGTPIQYDEGHLTSGGSIEVAKKMRDLKIFSE